MVGKMMVYNVQQYEQKGLTKMLCENYIKNIYLTIKYRNCNFKHHFSRFSGNKIWEIFQFNLYCSNIQLFVQQREEGSSILFLIYFHFYEIFVISFYVLLNQSENWQI
jgi:hypothetical protein